VRRGAIIALANKECIVAAGDVFREALAASRAVVIPVDSEHNAAFQILDFSQSHAVDCVTLTASGGPFRGWSVEQLQAATRTDALRHPTWAMGEKITIDSSTLMNKGLEILEAAALFDVAVDRVGVVVHPQSIVHSMVEYVDGSTIAQLSNPDMRLPIAYALALPGRYHHAWGTLDLANALQLDFEPPDRVAFPALDLAFEAGRRGGAAPAWLSAANEIAVAAFLADEIRWVDIVSVVSYVMAKYEDDPLDTLDAVRANDAQARAVAEERIRQIH